MTHVHNYHKALTNVESMNTLLDVNQYKSVLVLNGIIDNTPILDGSLTIIAADGAANKLYDMGVIPDIIIGDLDSVHPDVLQHTSYLHIADQNTGDFAKAAHYIKENNLFPTIVLGLNGGCIDHILHNISIFMAVQGTFYAPPIVGYILTTATTHQLQLNINTKLSLIAMTECTLSTQGLKWELHHTKLSFIGHNSYFNRSAANQVSISVHQGTCLLMIYTEPILDAGEYS